MTFEIATERVVLASGLPVYLATPKAPGPFPSVIHLHERYGFVQHTWEFADRLAQEGYAVAAPDLYYQFPDQDALHRGDARVYDQMSDSTIVEMLVATVGRLSESPAADTTRLGMIGVCATGRYPIVYGSQHPIQACVAYYGATSGWEESPDHPESMASMVRRLNAPVLGLFGELDHLISVDQVRALRNLLEDNDRSYDITIFEGAPHGWINDTMPGRYRPAASEAAWQKLLGFLKQATDPPGPEADVVSWKFSCVKSVHYDAANNVRLE